MLAERQEGRNSKKIPCRSRPSQKAGCFPGPTKTRGQHPWASASQRGPKSLREDLWHWSQPGACSAAKRCRAGAVLELSLCQRSQAGRMDVEAPPPLSWVASRCEGGLPSGSRSRVSGLSEAAEGRVRAGPQARLARSWEQSCRGCRGRTVPIRARRGPQREVRQGSLR